MATKVQRLPRTYAVGSVNTKAPLEIIRSTLLPTSADKSQIGTRFLNTTTGLMYVLTGITGGLANWSLISSTPVASTAASPTAAITSNYPLVSLTFTGFTTAAAATQVFTLTDSLISATSSLSVTIANKGANDAQMTLTRVLPADGSVQITVTNNGAAALNGDVIISVQVLS